MNLLSQRKLVNRVPAHGEPGTNRPGRQHKKGNPLLSGFPFVAATQPMAKKRPLLSLGTGEVDVGIATGLRRTEAFSLEGPRPLRSFEPSRSTCNFVGPFK